MKCQLADSAVCACCTNKDEITLHVLCDSPMAYALWTSLKVGKVMGDFFRLDLRSWMVRNLMMCGPTTMVKNWSIAFGVGCWKLWEWRNRRLFDAEFNDPSMPNKCIIHPVEEILHAAELKNKVIHPLRCIHIR